MESIWIISAFLSGLAAKFIHMPPMLGYLFVGFVLNFFNVQESIVLKPISDLGIQLLLFTIGLKLHIRTLLKPEILITTIGQISIALIGFMAAFMLATYFTIDNLFNLSIFQSFLIAFALSFSSTVCAIKLLEDRGELSTRHSNISIGILVLEDVAAVVFLTITAQKIPSIWAFSLILLPFIRPLLYYVLEKSGHDELLCLYGFFLTFSSAWLFKHLGVKADLGPLVFGILIANHPKSSELYKSLLRFKELFLICFFISVGYAAKISLDILGYALIIVSAVIIKQVSLMSLLLIAKVRAKSAYLASLSLMHYSEFGLIVAALSANNGWLSAEWLAIIALSVAGSFFLAAFTNMYAHNIFRLFKVELSKLERKEVLPEDIHHQIGEVDIVIIGIGKIGDKVYKALSQKYNGKIAAIDANIEKVKLQLNKARRTILGDGTNSQFWDSQKFIDFKIILLAVPNVQDSLEIKRQLDDRGYKGKIAAISMHIDEAAILRDAGINFVFNYHSEIGLGYANHVLDIIGQNMLPVLD